MDVAIRIPPGQAISAPLATRKLFLLFALRIAKKLGLFRVARALTARDLRILCYHGAALADEHAFRAGLFMREATFAARMEHLARHSYPVLALGDALDRLAQGRLPAAAVVITIDDGWYGTYKAMTPILGRYRFPATLYIATYYLQKQTQVFNVACRYALWKSAVRLLYLNAVSPALRGSYDLNDSRQVDAVAEALSDFAETLRSAEERQRLLRRLCESLDLDWRAIEAGRLFGFMTAEEARRIADLGVEVQLHTHRHRFPSENPERARSEIDDNRKALEAIASRPLVHFCYPSGIYSREQTAWFDGLGIVSATTTKPGFNRRRTPRHELRRFLDRDDISMLEFDAEMSGFFELIRRCGYRI